ncbi:hypothetical protein PNEG_02588 [Pneumocystis murina B123]|uniref:Uncharacterized protein n=1 Tax=Pneumocystis murina (strain B123) TaxID=1069680 RepID=M7PFN1_PNEMU|nr:hypothetical protein PNEG_02588 [Pneumocystis murina B123]EMR09254.1 hypothetical protein PNEG_02588 [Pneumocystis murina B123]
MNSKIQKTSEHDILVNLTPEESEAYEKLFCEADPDNIGVLLGENSINFFEKTGLSPQILGEIWKIADDENMGFLTRKRFNIALRLVGHAQEGRRPSIDLINLKCPLPKFNTKKPINWNIPSQPPEKIPLITTEERNRYHNMFKNLKLTNGFIKGSQAKSIFLRTHLSNEILGQIWNLVDIHHRGALNITEFTVAMHLIHSFINGSLKKIPSILPPWVFNMAIGKTYSHGSSHKVISEHSVTKNTSNLNEKDFSNNLSRKYYKHQHVHSKPNLFFEIDTIPPNDWNIKPQERFQYSNLFKSIDKANENYLTGDEAVSFFLSSKLPEKTLAHIWDLADLDKSGKLNKEEFIIAIHLIRQKLVGVDLPASLPQELMPPFFQKNLPQENTYFLSPSNQEPSSSITTESFDINNSFSPQVQTTSPSLPSSIFSIKQTTTDPYVEASAIIPSSDSVFSPSCSHLETPSIHSSQRAPFISTSAFKQSIVSSVTPDSKASLQKPSTTVVDLLSDTNIENLEKKDNDTSEMENTSNKISSLSKQIQELKQTVTLTESELKASNDENCEIEERLSQIYILYKKEVKTVQKIQEDLTESRATTQKLKQKYSILKTRLYTLQNQKQEQLENLKHSTDENIELQHKIELMNNQLSCLKEELENIGKDSLDQKNMIMMSKKQLSIFEDNYTQLKANIDKDIVIHNVNENNDSDSVLSTSNQSSNPFHQISDSNEIKQISPLFIPVRNKINTKGQSNIQDNSIKDLSSNINLQILKRRDSLSESLDSSVVVQAPESTPGKLSRISSYPGTPIPWIMNKSNSPKILNELSSNFDSDIFLKDSSIEKFEFYKENPYYDLEVTNVSSNSKKNSDESCNENEFKKGTFNVNNLDTELLYPSNNKEDISLDSSSRLDDILYKECSIRYSDIQNTTLPEENITGKLPGTFPVDSDSRIVNQEIYYTFNDKEKSIKDDKTNKKTENAHFDPFSSKNSNDIVPKKNKADFDEAFSNFIAESDDFSKNDNFASKFPPIEDFHNLSESNDINNYNNDLIAHNKNKDPVINLSTFNADYNVSYNTETSTTDGKNIMNSNTVQLLINNFKETQSKESLSSLHKFDSNNIEISDVTLQLDNIPEKYEDKRFHDLIATKEVNSFKSDLSTQDIKFNTFFTQPFSEEPKHDWVAINCTTDSPLLNGQDISINPDPTSTK